MRLLLAIQCFFLVLFAGRLPEKAQKLLPAPEPPKLPPGPSPDEIRRELDEKHTKELTGARAESERKGALLMLSILQREGRLVDFLEEDISTYADAQVGAAVRDIHKGCKKALEEHVKVQPVLAEPDEAQVKVAPGFDPSAIKLVGNVVGQPPFTGTLRHPGWRADGVKLPELPASADASVIAPAEVELP